MSYFANLDYILKVIDDYDGIYALKFLSKLFFAKLATISALLAASSKSKTSRFYNAPLIPLTIPFSVYSPPRLPPPRGSRMNIV